MATSAALEQTDCPEISTLDDLVTPEYLAEERPDLFPLKSLRWQLQNRHHNGLSDAGAVMKVGRKIMLSRSRLLAWISSRQT